MKREWGKRRCRRGWADELAQCWVRGKRDWGEGCGDGEGGVVDEMNEDGG